MADQSFWQWALDKTFSRAQAEGWTPHDCEVALLQISLLSYASTPAHIQVYGEHYPSTSPEDYQNNAPWNDWTPPSKSLSRLEEALANKTMEQIHQRVRARLCASTNPAGLRESLLVFASVELNDRGQRSLQLRRGTDVLATMTLRSLRLATISNRTIELAPQTHSKVACSPPVVFLSFEDEARVERFLALLRGSVK